MPVEFNKNAYYALIRENEKFKEGGSVITYAMKHLQFKYGEVDYKKFAEKYSSNGWFGRKIIALPAAVYSGVVMTVYHLAKALLLGIPKAHTDKSVYLKKHIFYVVRDLQESFGWLISLLSDSYGQFHIQESQFHKCFYDCFTKHITPRESDPDDKPKIPPKTTSTKRDTQEKPKSPKTEISKKQSVANAENSKEKEKATEELTRLVNDHLKTLAPTSVKNDSQWRWKEGLWLISVELQSTIFKFLSKLNDSYLLFLPSQNIFDIVDLELGNEEITDDDFKTEWQWAETKQQIQVYHDLFKKSAEKLSLYSMSIAKDSGELFLKELQSLCGGKGETIKEIHKNLQTILNTVAQKVDKFSTATSKKIDSLPDKEDELKKDTSKKLKENQEKFLKYKEKLTTILQTIQGVCENIERIMELAQKVSK